MYELTKAQRYEACIHEAAHAVIYSIGNTHIFHLAVAPEGCKEWSYPKRKGGTSTDLWGVCVPSESSVLWSLRWDQDDRCYKADKSYYHCLPPEMRPEWFRDIRANVCATLAGPIAEEIRQGATDIWIDPFGDKGEDAPVAAGLSLLLPWRHEYDYLNDLTDATLRRPDVWAMVVRLADELERVGDMANLDAFLPAAAAKWPPSPRAKYPAVIGVLARASD